MTKAERQHMSAVAALGCIVCLNEGHGYSPCGIHHKRGGQGLMRASHYDTIGLCDPHHQTGGYGIAFHAGKKAWEARYGTEDELLAQVRELLNGEG